MRTLDSHKAIRNIMLSLAFTAPLAIAAHHDRVNIEQCLRAASNIKAGDYVKVEYLQPSAKGIPTYEIEVRDKNGKEWEFMCNAIDGNIYEIEQEVDSSDDKLFSLHKKVSEETAKKTVLDLYPGKVIETEYEIESNGDATYEFDVLDSNGVEFKVEVDAASGKIMEVHVEQWEIGEETGEKN